MANLKAIRKRISSVRSTQKITRAMKLVAGARLNRAQARIVALRPFARRTGRLLGEIVAPSLSADGAELAAELASEQPLLARRAEARVLLLVITSDRGLCGAFNANVSRAAERQWRARVAAGEDVQIVVVGRKGRDFLRRRGAPIREFLGGVWDRLDGEQSRRVARSVIAPFVAGEVDAVYVVYNEFKSAMSQRVVVEGLLPLQPPDAGALAGLEAVETFVPAADDAPAEPIFEPGRRELLAQLVPMYLEVTLLRALLESHAAELGARMTAMDAATKSASELIERLTLSYNRARQAAITTELMEIIGGADALAG